jgi:hypothetical protein
MKAQTTFGRRQLPQTSGYPKLSVPTVQLLADMPSSDAQTPSDDEELQQWRAARGIRIPWRPLLLIASLSFGMAAFVRPASTSDPVQWALGGLSAASFLAGLKRRVAKRIAE